MATLVLRSSCAPPGGTASASFDVDDGGGGGGDDLGDRSGASRAAFVGPAPPRWPSPSTAPTRIDDDADDDDYDEEDDDDVREYLTSLPVRCDVWILPRLPPARSDGSPSDRAANDDATDDATDDVSSRALAPRFERRRLRPCGSTSTIVARGLPPSVAGYVLRLSECESDAATGDPRDALLAAALPVDVFPAEFSIGGGGDGSRGGGLEGEVEPSIVEVSFDHSEATEVYRERLRIEGGRAAPNATDADAGPPLDGRCRLSDPPRCLDDPRAAVLRNLEAESRKIERALGALGALLATFVVALGWTLYGMRAEKKKARKARRRRRRIVLSEARTRRDVPREIERGIAPRGAGGGGADGSESLDSRPAPRGAGRVRIASDVSPLSFGTSSATDDDDEVRVGEAEATDDRSPDGEVCEGCDGTAGLDAARAFAGTSERTPPPPTRADPQDAAPHQRGGSPRHWYEDFLSPPGRAEAKKDGREEGEGEDGKEDEEEEEVRVAPPRVLFSPLKRGRSEDASEDDREGSAEAEEDGAEDRRARLSRYWLEGSGAGDVPSPVGRPPFASPASSAKVAKKKKPAFSPPPSGVSPLLLSRQFEDEWSEASGGASRGASTEASTSGDAADEADPSEGSGARREAPAEAADGAVDGDRSEPRAKADLFDELGDAGLALLRRWEGGGGSGGGTSIRGAGGGGASPDRDDDGSPVGAGDYDDESPSASSVSTLSASGSSLSASSRSTASSSAAEETKDDESCNAEMPPGTSESASETASSAAKESAMETDATAHVQELLDEGSDRESSIATTASPLEVKGDSSGEHEPGQLAVEEETRSVGPDEGDCTADSADDEAQLNPAPHADLYGESTASGQVEGDESSVNESRLEGEVEDHAPAPASVHNGSIAYSGIIDDENFGGEEGDFSEDEDQLAPPLAPTHTESHNGSVASSGSGDDEISVVSSAEEETDDERDGIQSPPKLQPTTKRSPFAEELRTRLAQRAAQAAEAGSERQQSSNLPGDGIERAKKAAEETWSPTKRPATDAPKRMLSPSRSTPASAKTGSSSREFLSDYW